MSQTPPADAPHDASGEWPASPHSAEIVPYWLAAVVDSADDAIVTKTLEGVITSWNRGAERLFGYAAEEAVGRSVTILIPPDHADEEPAILARIRSGERVEHYETVRVRKDGSRVHISLTVSPIRDSEGRVIGASKIARDITERKRAEEELHRREEELTDFVENSAVGLHWVAADGTIIWANRAELELLGYAREEYVGRNIAEFHADSDVIGDILTRLTADQTLHNYEARLRCKDGSVRHVLISSNVRRREGEFIHTRCFTRDITERKQAEEERARLYLEAEEASRLKDEFLATVSHELRTPLTSVLGWAHMLRTGHFSADEVSRALETIERNARAQAQLIDDLLDVSRIITGKLRLEVRPVEPASFVEAAVEALRPAAEAKGIGLEQEIEAGAATVSGDPARLQQVAWNLISNAIKFTPPGGLVRISVTRSASHVQLVVTDSGSGIAPEFLPHVFDRFRQQDGTTTRRHGGLGLGLAIVRHLVELHGGSVRAESGGEGRGSAFTVLLPAAPAGPARPPGPHGNAEAREAQADARVARPLFDCPDRLDGLRVLVVDDDADAREVLRAGLAHCGAVVEVAGSAEEALAAVRASAPELLISDIGMPGEDGYALIRRVRELPAGRGGRVPAVALTAYARAEDRMQALRAGYQMHVSKPVELAELAAVAASLRRR